jgi:hypothetical protein
MKMTIDPSARFDDPFGEAFGRSSQKAAQFVSMAASAYEMAVRRKQVRAAKEAARKEQERRALQEQERAAREAARAGWAPAFDRRWSAQADLPLAGRVWCASAPYAGSDPEAASALRRAEERLRVLHPYAMARYDRLRNDGAGLLAAMREAAPLFDRFPQARPGQPGTPRPAIRGGVPGAESQPANVADSAPQPGFRQAPGQDAERQGLRIADQMQARALAQRGARLSPDELATALETTTTLPAEVIARVARDRGEENTAARVARARVVGQRLAEAVSEGQQADGSAEARDQVAANAPAGDKVPMGKSAARLAAESFPLTVSDGIRASVSAQLRQSAVSPTRTAATRKNSRPRSVT